MRLGSGDERDAEWREKVANQHLRFSILIKGIYGSAFGKGQLMLSRIDQFEDLYKKLGVDGALHMTCPFARSCWVEEHRPRANGEFDLSERTKLPRPWIGRDYEKLGLLCVAINMNGSGGRNECEYLVNAAREKIKMGYKRVRFENAPNYKGTPLYYKMGVYAVEIATAQNYLQASNNFPSTQEVFDIYDSISHTNHVKCSPDDEKTLSEPTANMWCNCGKYVLREEILLLKPRTLMLLGKTDNHKHFIERVVDFQSYQSLCTCNSVTYGRAKVGNHQLEIITVPHPSYFRFTTTKVVSDLRFALKESCN